MKISSYFRALAVVALSMGAIGSASAASEPLTIYTGGKGGGYDKAAQNVAARLEQRGLEVMVENRNGSDDITLQSCRNGRSAWVAQIDALYIREMKDGCYLSVISDYGDEVAMLFFPPGSDMDELDEITASTKVFVDKVGSGSELSWRTMSAIEKEHGRGDEWSDAEVVTGDMRRVNALANRGKINAVFLVRKPGSDQITKLLDSGWELGYLYDKDINDLMFGEKPLYEAVKATVSNGDRNWGYIVKSFVGTTEEIEVDDMDTFDALLSALE